MSDLVGNPEYRFSDVAAHNFCLGSIHNIVSLIGSLVRCNDFTLRDLYIVKYDLDAVLYCIANLVNKF